MNYHDYRPFDVLNGKGVRSTLFLSGCIHGCKGCYNAETWDPASGQLYDEVLEQRIIDDLNDESLHRRGLSLTGGDPLHPNNREGVISLISRVKKECPGKDIWLWTGFTIEEIWANKNAAMRSILGMCDVVIDGKFIQKNYDPSLIFRGSSNQRVFKRDGYGPLKPVATEDLINL